MYGELITTLVTDSDTATAVLEKRIALQGKRSENGKGVSATVEGRDQSGLLQGEKV